MIGFQIGAGIILWGVLVNASFCQVLLGPSIGAGTNYLRKLVMRKKHLARVNKLKTLPSYIMILTIFISILHSFYQWIGDGRMFA